MALPQKETLQTTNAICAKAKAILPETMPAMRVPRRERAKHGAKERRVERSGSGKAKEHGGAQPQTSKAMEKEAGTVTRADGPRVMAISPRVRVRERDT